MSRIRDLLAQGRAKRMNRSDWMTFGVILLNVAAVVYGIVLIVRHYGR
jgi:hypothetical protein